MIELEGMDKLIIDMNNLGNVGTKAGKKAVKKGLEVVLDTMKTVAPKNNGNSIVPSPNEGHGRDQLDIQYIKAAKNGDLQGACGIGSKNWDSTKQLWFQNFGFENKGLNFNGNHVVSKNVGWMTKAQEKSKDKALSETVKTLSAEIDKVLK